MCCVWYDSITVTFYGKIVLNFVIYVVLCTLWKLLLLTYFLHAAQILCDWDLMVSADFHALPLQIEHLSQSALYLAKRSQNFDRTTTK